MENKRACLQWLAASTTMTPMWILPSHVQIAVENGHIVCGFVYVCMYMCGGVRECLHTPTCGSQGVSLRVAP